MSLLDERNAVVTSLRSASFAFVFCALGMVAGAAHAAETTPETGSIPFCVNLSPDEESAPTYGSAVGQGTFSLSRADLKFTWEISFKDLTSRPLAANMHGPQRPGANAGVVFALVGEGQPITSPLRGSLTLNDGQLEYLLTERLYMNITTQKYMEGELRGQLKRLHPGEACPPPYPPAK